jgi:hypothetical protein
MIDEEYIHVRVTAMQQMYPNPNFDARIVDLRRISYGWGRGDRELFDQMYLLLNCMKEIVPFKAPIVSPCQGCALSLRWDDLICEVYVGQCLYLAPPNTKGKLYEHINETTLLEAAIYLLNTQGVRCTNKLD